MTTPDSDPKVLHAVRGYAGWHLVTGDVLDEAAAAQARSEAESYLTEFGELRRSGDIEELSDRLSSSYGIDLDDYIAAIERAAGVEPSGATASERLAALADVDFAGDDDAPADTDGFRTEHELENRVEDHYLFTIEQGMVTSVPSDVLAAFQAQYSPTFTEGDFAAIDDEYLEAMIAVLEAQGFTIIRP